ncbi:MAG TPA: hypothetical protein VM734_09875 [Kofleriaceae bacterium]|jgi:hypothetical protein|nr:hypothetical protein [Kofleriaceae bacterium]
MTNQGYGQIPHAGQKTTAQKVLDKVFAPPIRLAKRVIGAVLLRNRQK